MTHTRDRKLDKGTQFWQRLAATWVIEREAGHIFAKSIKRGLKHPRIQIGHHERTRQAEQSGTTERRPDAQIDIVDHQGTGDRYGDRPPPDDKSPVVRTTRIGPMKDAAEAVQIFGARRPAPRLAESP